MMKTIRWTQSLLVLVGLLLALDALAGPDEIRTALSKAMPGVQIDQVSASPIEGLYEVTVGLNLYYVSDDGRYLINGSLFDLEAPPSKRDLTETKLGTARLNALHDIGEENMIQFKAPLQKHVVSVFTDVDCGYCRKLHSEIDEYLKQGITIDYLFYPRAGIGSESYKKAVAVWCADDRQSALTRAKLGETIEMKECANPVAEHMKLAGDFQIRGTPMIVTDTGEVFPGYIPALELSRRLEQAASGSDE